MFGLKKEIYVGPDNDRCKLIISKLKDSGIKFYVDHQISHASDPGRDAGVGIYGESGDFIIKILVKKSDYEAAAEAVRKPD